MPAAEAARKVTMLPRMIDMVARIMATRVVPDPLIVRVNVGSVRMPRLVIESAVRLFGMPLAPDGGRATRRNVAALMLAATVSTAMLSPVLRQNRNSDQRYRKYAS
jgi:hypothetical protein